MKNWREKLERHFMAVAFAEAGEHESAISFAGIKPWRNRFSKFIRIFEDTFVAAAFAEADCPEPALDRIGRRDFGRTEPPLEIFLRTVGLQGIQVRYGIVTAG